MPKISQNLDTISKKLFFFSIFRVFFFLNCPGEKSYLKKSMQYALPNLDYISSNIITQIWNTWRVKIAHFITTFNFYYSYSYFLLEVKYLFSEIPMFPKNTQIRSKTKLKLQFCRSRLKNEQNRRTLFDVGICKILIKS